VRNACIIERLELGREGWELQSIRTGAWCGHLNSAQTTDVDTDLFACFYSAVSGACVMLCRITKSNGLGVFGEMLLAMTCFTVLLLAS